MVGRAIPDAWQYSSPELALTARTAAADAALRRLWGDAVNGAEVREAAVATMAVASALHGGGRPIYTATAALDEPEAPHLKLWHACTLLREHRFDGHVAALTVHGLDGLEALVTAVATGSGVDGPTIRLFRGWTEEEWADGVARLQRRGVLDAAGGLTEEGRELRNDVESMTDRLAADPWEALDEASREPLFATLRGLALLLENKDGIRYPNPIGVPRPE
jgi:hypothetical protein